MAGSARVLPIFTRTPNLCNRALRSTSPVAWLNVNLIGNFDFTTSSTPVDIEALAARFQNEDFWRRSMQENDEESPEQ
jgi:hypothetical protein